METPRRGKDGYCIQWVVCRRCGYVGSYKYIPYGLSARIFCLPCGHGVGESDYGMQTITAERAKELKQGRRYKAAIRRIRA